MEKENINKVSSPRDVVGDLRLIKSLYKKVFPSFNTTKSAEDSRQKLSGMTSFFSVKAFSLIELLVVVLIIGILSAIALPQYQKAVLTSRFATVKSLVHSIANAQEIYYLANGHYASSFSDLDIDTPNGWSVPEGKDENTVREFSWGTCSLSTAALDCNTPTPNSYLEYNIWFPHATGVASGYHGKAACVAGNDDLTSVENQICKAETQLTSPSYPAGGHAVWRYDN